MENIEKKDHCFFPIYLVDLGSEISTPIKQVLYIQRYGIVDTGSRKEKMMRRKTQRLQPYFHVGHKVQLRPVPILPGRSLCDGAYATITRIKQLPDPEFLSIETQEEWEEFLRIRSVRFWVKLDDFPELHDYYKQNEVVFRYCELQPVSPRMDKHQLAQYCKECFMKERDEQRRYAYLGVMRYLLNGEQPGWPLSSLDVPVPNGYAVDLMNRFISGATEIRKLAQKSQKGDQTSNLASFYEVQAQVCDEMYQCLMPKQHVLV